MNVQSNQSEQQHKFIKQEIDFKTRQEFKEFIKQKDPHNYGEIVYFDSISQQVLKSQLSDDQLVQIFDDPQNKMKTQLEGYKSNYQKFIDEKYRRLELPDQRRLQKFKLESIDIKLEYQQGQQETKDQFQQQITIQNDLANQTENDRQNDSEQQQILVPTKNRSIKIQEQSQISNKQEATLQEHNKKLVLNQQQYQEEQKKISSILTSKQQNHIQNIKKYEKYDEIRDEQNRLIMQLSRFEIKIFQDDNVSNIIVKELFKEDYEFSLNLDKVKDDITDSSFPYVRFNQQIGLKDKHILISSKLFLTSSIINAYANYLQAIDENYYFSLKKKERIKHQRLFIFTSDFITDCNLQNLNLNYKIDQQKLMYLATEYLRDFKSIQYQFWLIYKKIAFIVNSNNVHWYLAVLDYKDGCLKIYDSIPKQEQSYKLLNDLLSFLFSKLSSTEINFQTFVCPTWNKQQDFYSCGYHTCLALEYLSQNAANSQCLTQQEIQDVLIQLLIKKEPQKMKNLIQ